MKVNGPETFRANTSKGAANRVTCLRTIDSSPNLRLSKSDSTPLGAIPDPLRLREESAKKLPIRVDYSLSLSLILEKKLIPGSKKRLINGAIVERKITTNFPRKRNGKEYRGSFGPDILFILSG